MMIDSLANCPLWLERVLAPAGERRIGRAKLLVLDSSYSFETLTERGQLDSVTCRDLGGFFGYVWTVHPIATLITSPSWTSKYGLPVWHEINEHHTFIEGKVGRLDALGRVFLLNFLLAQAGLFVRLLRLVRQRRISAIRAGDPLYCGLFGLMLARASGVPFVVRVNGNNVRIRETTGRLTMPRLFRFSAVERFVERFVLARADWVFAPNDDNLQFALSSGAVRERSSVVSFGGLLDRRHFLPPSERDSADADRMELGLHGDPFLLLVGRLIPPKYPDHVIRVADFLRGNGIKIKVVLVGSGEMKTELRELAQTLGIEEQVVFAGGRSQDWLWRVLPRAALVLSPSTGRALSEAALAAAPIVAYDTDWQKDLILNEQTGFLVAYRDWEAMAAAALKLMKDRKLARRLGEQGRERAMAILDPAAAVAEERAVYSRLFEERRLPSRELNGH